MINDIDKKRLLYILRNYVKMINYPLSYKDDSRFFYENSNFNCYAYALGLRALDNFDFLIEEDLSIYNPGTISSFSNILYSEKSLIRSFLSDCKVLGIECVPTSVDSKMINNTAKVGVYISSNKRVLYRDFHFVRQNNDGIWSNMKFAGGPVVEMGRELPEKIENYDFLGVYSLRKKR